MQRLSNSVPFFPDASGAPLTGGYIYVGTADTNPIDNPLDLFWDEALTVPASQPLRTISGLIVNGTTPAAAFMADGDYSQTVLDDGGVQVFYSGSVFASLSGLQPLNSNLTAISALSTQAFGRNLLTLANAGALATATGIPAPLPAAGGTVTGNIVRATAGSHWYWVDPTLTSGRVFTTANGAADPTSQPGDVWIEEAP